MFEDRPDRERIEIKPPKPKKVKKPKIKNRVDVRRYAQKMKDMGYCQMTLWVPRILKEPIKAVLRGLIQKYEAEALAKDRNEFFEENGGNKDARLKY